MSSSGTISGGSGTKRSLPSISSASLVSTRVLSRVRALATSRAVCSTSFLPTCSSPTCVCIHAIRSATRMCSYHASSAPMRAAPSIVSRYPCTPAITTSRRSAGVNPRSRPQISRLAARRFTSHSHGPGSVSSKSLMSNSRCRSGEANMPKFDRCASPQSCTVNPVRGVAARSDAMINAPPRKNANGDSSIRP